MKILEMSHYLPHTAEEYTSCWEGVALGGFDCIVQIPKSKWDIDLYFDPDPGNRDDFVMYTRHMGVLEDQGTMSSAELLAFGLSQEDPRQTLLLRSVQDCFGQSGLSKEELRNQSMGFFCGLSGNEMYHKLVSGDLKSIGRAAQGLMSNAANVNRLAWYYATRGPSICVDTEESSGAAAMDTALNYQREDRCSKAIVCSTHLIQHPVSLIVCCAMGQLSTTTRGRAFDESADGVMRSEGSVALFLEVFGRRKVDDFEFGFPEDPEDELEEEDLTTARAIVAGSALNSRGQSSSLTTPSGPAMRDLIHSALKDSKSPACIIDAVEVSAGGSPLMDAVELGVLRTTLQRGERNKVLSSFKSVIGESGPPSGLAALVRACLTVQKAVHGPQLHLRQLCSLGAVEDEEEDVELPPLLATEALPSSSLQQTLGISSFGNSGTNVQMVLMGSSPQPQDTLQKGTELRWFPATLPETTETSYHVIGSFNCWEEPLKMEVESKGVYGFTMVLGENRWETFQIWEDGDPDKVLHPGSHWADMEASVLGPSRQAVCGRYATWRISGKPTKVRLLNEDQAQEMGVGTCAEEMLSYAGDVEIRMLTAFPGDYMPEGGEIPVVDQDEQLLGMPGDRYRVLLRLGGKYRRVEWRKLTTTVPQALRASSYYIAGDFNFWEFQPMQEEEASAGSKARSFFTEVKLRSSEDVFQVVRNKDWDQAFYPQADTQNLRGPDGYGVAKGWRLPGKAGDVFRIHFRRTLPSSGVDDKSVSWSLQPPSASPSQELALQHSYCIVGSWSSFVSKDSMTFDQAKSTWLAEVQVGQSGMEFFQILLNGNWLAAVYPNSYEADFRRNGHVVLGPDSRGGRSYWCLQDGLEPGDRVQVMLEVDAVSMPKAVRWQKAS